MKRIHKILIVEITTILIVSILFVSFYEDIDKSIINIKSNIQKRLEESKKKREDIEAPIFYLEKYFVTKLEGQCYNIEFIDNKIYIQCYEPGKVEKNAKFYIFDLNNLKDFKTLEVPVDGTYVQYYFKNGKMIVCGNKEDKHSIFVYDENIKKIFEFYEEVPDVNWPIPRLLDFKDNLLLFATNNGVYLYDLEKNSKIFFKNISLLEVYGGAIGKNKIFLLINKDYGDYLFYLLDKEGNVEKIIEKKENGEIFSVYSLDNKFLLEAGEYRNVLEIYDENGNLIKNVELKGNIDLIELFKNRIFVYEGVRNGAAQIYLRFYDYAFDDEISFGPYNVNMTYYYNEDKDLILIQFKRELYLYNLKDKKEIFKIEIPTDSYVLSLLDNCYLNTPYGVYVIDLKDGKVLEKYLSEENYIVGKSKDRIIFYNIYDNNFYLLQVKR